MIGIKPAAGIALIALTFTTIARSGAEERMRTGLWEVSTSFDKQAGSLRNLCYTPAMVELANMPEKLMREATERTFAKRSCTLKEFKLERNTLSMTTICPEGSVATSSTYSGDAFETVGTSTDAGVTHVTHIKGRRIGECK